MPFVVALLLILMSVFSEMNAAASEPPEVIVATDHQCYSYDEMMEDVILLCGKYPSQLSWRSEGTTDQGRELIVLTLGNPDARHKVMVQSSMHAREYAASQLTMAIVEFILDNMDSREYRKVSYAELFDDTCFVIMPMVNPDGVMISQQGTASAARQELLSWLGPDAEDPGALMLIKSNGNGVDINRNFPQGFGQCRYAEPLPGMENFPGFAPISEPESRALAAVADSIDFDCHINYHTAGNIIYYGDILADDRTQEASVILMEAIKNLNGYTDVLEEQDETGYGCFSNYVTEKYQRPTVTVEVGTANPVPIRQFEDIFMRNRDTWAAVAYLLYTGQL